jgi:hypothetical protein
MEEETVRFSTSDAIVRSCTLHVEALWAAEVLLKS